MIEESIGRADISCIGDDSQREQVNYNEDSTRTNKKKRKVQRVYIEDNKKIARFSEYQNNLWHEQLQRLFQFKVAYGHCDVPINCPKNQVLARWVKRQRYHYKRRKEGKSCAINSQRIALLESIGFTWDAHATAWKQKYNELVAYKHTMGHCNIRFNDPTNVQLSTWVKCQRRQYKLYQSGQQSNMTTGRIEALNALGFGWTTECTKNN